MIKDSNDITGEIAKRQNLMILQEIENQCYAFAMADLKSGAIEAAVGWIYNYGMHYERIMKNIA